MISCNNLLFVRRTDDLELTEEEFKEVTLQVASNKICGTTINTCKNEEYDRSIIYMVTSGTSPCKTCTSKVR